MAGQAEALVRKSKGFSPSSGDRRSSERGHPIQYVTREDGFTPLPSWTARSKTVADD